MILYLLTSFIITMAVEAAASSDKRVQCFRVLLSMFKNVDQFDRGYFSRLLD
jgi:hypothetical protein